MDLYLRYRSVLETRGPGQKVFGAQEDQATCRDIGLPWDTRGSYGGWGLPSCDFMSSTITAGVSIHGYEGDDVRKW